MSNSFNRLTVLLALFFLISCIGRKGKSAKTYLEEAELAHQIGKYSLAKLKIDSIKYLYPNAYDEIDAGFKLMQKIRKSENIRNIAYCDSMLQKNYSSLNNHLTKFDYVRDDQYQEFGEYYPKIYPHRSSLEKNGLRSGVSEKGNLFIESVLSGTLIKHNRIRITSSDGSFLESGVVTTDGLNYRFTSGGKSYEIVRFFGADENGIAGYIHSYNDKPLTVHFIGNRTIQISLTTNAKKGISQSFELSRLLIDIQRLKFEKERSETLIHYLESR